MEPKRKLLATTSSQAQGACPDHMKDRFSDLPDEVAHQILSSVSILDLTRFGTLSKKCRELYLSTPSLNFDEFNNWNKSSYAKQFKLLSSLDRFLVRRRENKIQCFRICWSLSYGKAASLYNELYRVVTWIHMAVRCNVEVLDLELRIPDTTRLELPSCIFLCGSLRSLSVHCNKILTAPSLALLREGPVSTPFDDMSYLGMHIESLDDDIVPAMVSLLRGMPNLKTFYIKSDPSLFIHKPEACGFNKEFWKSQNLAFIDQLKEATIELSNGNNGLELARYMLEDAKNLKEMVLLYSPQQSTHIRVVNESKMNSVATARVVFQEKQRK